jgi:hypothetical protein
METAHARIFLRVLPWQFSTRRSINRIASNTCKRIFACKANARKRDTLLGLGLMPHFGLTLRNHERYKHRSGAPFGASSRSAFSIAL